MTRVTITLSEEERNALIALGQRERRDPRDQAALIIRHELERFGMLPTTPVDQRPKYPEAQHAATAAA